MNECEHAGMCLNGECVNMDGSYKCVCKPGFKQSPDQQICIGMSFILVKWYIIKIINPITSHFIFARNICYILEL